VIPSEATWLRRLNLSEYILHYHYNPQLLRHTYVRADRYVIRAH
jgi:hypothetical protein